MTGDEETIDRGWRVLLKPEWLPALAVLAGGVLLQSMNVLMLATIMPTIVGELGGATMMSWPNTAFLASAIVAATCAGLLTEVIGARNAYGLGAVIFGVGGLVCAVAPAMGWIVAGRFVAGFGGGLLLAVAYVLLQQTFPQRTWARAIALLSGMWSVSILIGPLAGGVFARFGDWRQAFWAVSFIALVLTVSAFLVLPSGVAERRETSRSFPLARLTLICAAIACSSSAAIMATPLGKASLIALAVLALAAMLRLDRAAKAPLLPSDAFSFGTPTGIGLWLLLLMPVAYSPLQIYVPIFLQRLHGLDPLAAGYCIAGASLGWTAAALLTAGATGAWPSRLILAGPPVMAVGLMALALLAEAKPVVLQFPAIVVVGAGIGMCWAFVAQRVMTGAREGEGAVAASSVATVQQMGFALGAALSGLSANVSGLSAGLGHADLANAAFWVPASFMLAAAAAFLASVRLGFLRA
jgi:MFS family permease